MSSDRCSPLKLPIQIETSCAASKDHCKCDADNCQTNCQISTETLHLQGAYQNTCCNTLEQECGLTIAYLSNIRNNNCDPDVKVSLNPICIDWCDFLLLFYRSNNTFNIIPYASNLCAISFFGKTYQTTTTTDLKFNLGSIIRTAWANKCETTADHIAPKTNILLNKSISNISSLLNANSSISLSLDQAIETLLINNEIEPGDSTNSARVKFYVQYKYCFEPLNVCILVNFTYVTRIPCYKNVSFCDSWCPPYSRDPCVSCNSQGRIVNSQSEILSFLNKNNFDNESTTGFSDSNSQTGDESVSDLNKLDDKTFVSLDSSKW